MNRKMLVVIGCSAVVVAALVFAYAGSRNADLTGSKDKIADSTDNIPVNNQGESLSSDSTAQTGSEEAAAGTEITPIPTESMPAEPLNSENIPVGKNSAEYDLNAVLMENADQSTFLKLEYYLDGETVTREIPESNMPEIKGLFEKRASQDEKAEGFRIGQLLLNARYSKAYLTVIGSSSAVLEMTSVYEINLQSGACRKIGAAYGSTGSLMLNRNGKYLAFSYVNPPTDSNHTEHEMFDVADCSSEEFAVRFSRDLKGKPVGTNSPEGMVINYRLKAWKTDTILQLEQTSVKVGEKTGSKVDKPAEVLYDIAKNLLLNPDGTALQTKVTEATGKQGSATTTSAVTAGEESVKILKSFYSYLGEPDNYSKAMNLLDDGFYLEIGLLKQFGVDKVLKKDIDAENASIYREILKAAKLELVIQVQEEKSSSQIYYYQTLSLNEESQAKQALLMQLVKTSSGWKIASIEEQDVTKAPFAE